MARYWAILLLLNLKIPLVATKTNSGCFFESGATTQNNKELTV